MYASAKWGKTGVSINYFTHESIQSIYTPLKNNFEPLYFPSRVRLCISAAELLLVASSDHLGCVLQPQGDLTSDRNLIVVYQPRK